ncbi:hypothetical protein [Planosporangium flavigriseum]
MRMACWHMLNLPATMTGDGRLGTVDNPSPATAHLTVGHWRAFIRWLHANHPNVSDLSHVIRSHFEAWATLGETAATSEPGRRNRLVALSRLWAYSQALPPRHRLAEPPWTRRRMRPYLGEVPARSDNSTEPIPTATMGPLLTAAMFYVDRHLARATSSPALKQADRMALSGAGLVVIAYLTGMRPHEVMALRRGCSTIVEDPDGTRRYEVHGEVSKGVRDETGRHITAGIPREQPWVTIEPAYRAIQALERLAEEAGQDVLFGHLRSGRTGTRIGNIITVDGGNERISAFIQHANEHSAINGYPPIPDGPDDKPTLSRFRRTLAWHIVRQPGGEIALGVQYGHMRIVTGQGYAGRSEAGMLDVIDLEEVALALDTIDAIAERLSAGEVISGPAADTVKARVERVRHEFAGVKRTDRELARLRGLSHLQVFDVPHTLVVCAFQPSTAACLDSEEAAERRRTPAADRCVTGCANAARTNGHIAALRQRVHEAEADRDVSPAPLARRLDRQIQAWRDAITTHEQAAAAVTQRQPTTGQGPVGARNDS